MFIVLCLLLVREGRLELPILAELDPKSSASANFATLALDFIFFIFLFYLSKKMFSLIIENDDGGNGGCFFKMSSTY